MFDDHLLQTCIKEFEAKVKSLFEANQRSGKTDCKTPYLGTRYSINNSEKYRAELQVREVDALISRQRFAWTGPTWVEELPLRSEAIKALEADADPRLRMVGLYSRSLGRLNWDYRTHPEFRPYCCGLMAYQHTPKELRQDRQLVAEFPPMKLGGLADGGLCWRTEREIAADRALRDCLRRLPVVKGLSLEPDIRHEAGHC